MMRPVSLVLPPNAPDRLAWTTSGNGNNTRLILTWYDNSINETAFVVQRMNGTGPWVPLATIPSPLNQVNTTGGQRTYTDTTFRNNASTSSYRVVADNTVGYGGAFMSLSATSVSAAAPVILAPTSLAATLRAGPQVGLTWTDNAGNETGFVVQRSTDSGTTFTQVGTAPARNNTGSVTFTDTTVPAGTTAVYRVAAQNASGLSAWSNLANVVVPAMPTAPASFSATNGPNGNGNNRSVILSWTDSSANETGFTIQRATNPAFTTGLNTVTVAANTTTLTQTGLSRNTTYYYRIRANNGSFVWSAWVNASPITTNP